MLTILHTNDFHGTLNRERAEAIRGLKESTDGIYLDSGDCIKSGNLNVPLKPEAAWSHLATAGCDAGTIGNRETHLLESAFEAKMAGHEHPIVCANMRRRDGRLVFPEVHFLHRPDYRIAVIGTMVPMVTSRMAARHASAYLWDPPIPSIVERAESLRNEVDCLIAVTHIGTKLDLELARQCPHLDFILGGHSHTVLEEPERVGNTFVCQGGSHGKFVGRYLWKGRGQLEDADLIPLPASR